MAGAVTAHQSASAIASRLVEAHGHRAREALSRVAAQLSPSELEALLFEWRFWARPEQIAPHGDWDTWLLCAGLGFGKLLAVDTPIPVPLSSTAQQDRPGWSTMGALRVGDTVYDENGKPTTVTGAFQTETPETCYRMRFSDGTHVDAADTHLWVTWTHRDRKALGRSSYADGSRPPQDWPAWRAQHLHVSPWLSSADVNEALDMCRSGYSVRRACRETGVSRNAFKRHVAAGSFQEQQHELRTAEDAPGPRVRTTDDIRSTLTHGPRGNNNHSIPTCGVLAGGGNPFRVELAKFSPECGAILGILRTQRALSAKMIGERIGKSLTNVCGMIRRLCTAGLVHVSGVIRNTGKGAPRTRLYALTGDATHDVYDIDPYALGAWLGDGWSGAAAIKIGDADSEEMLRILGAAGLRVSGPVRRKDGVECATYPVGKGWFHRALRALGVLGNKHIPPSMLRAPAADRLALLQGLMDTDGHAQKNAGTVEFCNTKRALAEAICELARSLGQKPVFKEGRAMLRGRDVGPKFRVTWRPTVPVFRLERKLHRSAAPAAQDHRNHHRMIVSVDRIDSVQMRCISVDSPHRMYLCGEGMIPTHNTRTGAEWIRDGVERCGVSRVALVGATAADVRDTMVQGEAGLLAISPRWFRPTYEKSNRCVTWPNGAQAICFSAEEPDRLRGPVFGRAWADELAAWANLEETWNNLTGRMRHGDNPQIVITTTPRPLALLRELVADPTTVTVYGSTRTNVFVPKSYMRKLKRIDGTDQGRQEIDGEILDDRKGALFDIRWIKRVAKEPALRRVVVAVDPAVSTNRHSDETGIVAAGAGFEERGYVLADRSGKLTPDGWATATIELYDELDADCIVVETNRGGDMVKNTIRSCLKSLGRNPDSVRVVEVRAMRGKALRAEPIAALYEGGRVSHVGPFAALEKEMLEWDPAMADAKKAKSPNRLDAAVFALLELELGDDPRRAFEGIEEANESMIRFQKQQRAIPGELTDFDEQEREDRERADGGGWYGGPGSGLTIG